MHPADIDPPNGGLKTTLGDSRCRWLVGWSNPQKYANVLPRFSEILLMMVFFSMSNYSIFVWSVVNCSSLVPPGDARSSGVEELLIKNRVPSPFRF